MLYSHGLSTIFALAVRRAGGLPCKPQPCNQTATSAAIPQSPVDKGLPSTFPNLLETLGVRCLEPASVLILSQPGHQHPRRAYEVGRMWVCPLPSFPSITFIKHKVILKWSCWKAAGISLGEAGSKSQGLSLQNPPGKGQSAKPRAGRRLKPSA